MHVHQDGLTRILDGLDVGGRGDVLHKGRAGDVKVLIGEASVTTAGGVRTVTFPVTWTNLTQNAYGRVEPVLALDEPGLAAPTAPAGGQQATAVLERKDVSTWTALPLSTGTGGGHGPSAPFALAPGQSRTLTYRLKLTGYQKASVQLVGQALLDGSGSSAPTVGDTAGQLVLG
ncbi:hypothetical protein [Kitasatospora sp. NPDC007106]|uniref:hypothetical protein n=1 Tax=Kitasatospora sp. NPDC007106 TaxID=3156914 RepID=UPI0033F59FA1